MTFPSPDNRRVLARIRALAPPRSRSGTKIHRTRHTAGQRVLDATGKLKAVQAHLGHASISTTADAYTNWDFQQLEASLRQTFAAEIEE
jgi:site-specific recombinase XerC